MAFSTIGKPSKLRIRLGLHTKISRGVIARAGGNPDRAVVITSSDFGPFPACTELQDTIESLRLQREEIHEPIAKESDVVVRGRGDECLRLKGNDGVRHMFNLELWEEHALNLSALVSKVAGVPCSALDSPGDTQRFRIQSDEQ